MRFFKSNFTASDDKHYHFLGFGNYGINSIHSFHFMIKIKPCKRSTVNQLAFEEQ